MRMTKANREWTEKIASVINLWNEANCCQRVFAKRSGMSYATFQKYLKAARKAGAPIRRYRRPALAVNAKYHKELVRPIH